MICEKCGAELNEGSMFCNKCGAKIEAEPAEPEEVFCPNCGEELAEGSMFCNKCGAKIESEPEPVANAKPAVVRIHKAPRIEKEQEQAAPDIDDDVDDDIDDIEKTEKEKKYGKIETVIGAIGGVALIIVIIAMFNVDWRIDTRIMCGLSGLCLISLIGTIVLDIADSYIRKSPAKEDNAPLICSILGLVVTFVAFGYNPYCITGTIGCFLASEGTGGKVGPKVMGYIGAPLCVIANFIAFNNALNFDSFNQFLDKIF